MTPRQLKATRPTYAGPTGERTDIGARLALCCACGECGIDPATWECESRRNAGDIVAAVVEARAKGIDARLPLCASCASYIGGACAGPDLPWRPAREGEACGAADHDHDGDDDPCACGGCSELAIDGHGGQRSRFGLCFACQDAGCQPGQPCRFPEEDGEAAADILRRLRP